MVRDRPEVEKSGQLLWLEKEIVPKIVKALGKDDENLRSEINVPTESFFVSGVYMLDLISLREVDTGEEKIRLVVKVQPEQESTRIFMGTDNLFHNEIIFYQRFGKNYSDYPRCVLTLPEPITSAVIVMENVTQFGYKSVQPKDIGMKHALAAVREIGKFHARGYVLKEKNSKEFFGVAEAIHEFHVNSQNQTKAEYFSALSMRPVNYLRSVNYDPEFCEKMSTFLSEAMRNVILDCIKPRNELAVLCHGDFTSNNVLFKEDDDEFKAMLIDFAQLRYASPATDVSTFLYLGCDYEVRKNFPVIFRAYHDAVLKYLKDQGIEDLEKYSFDAFLKDYKRHAIFGCLIAISFLTVLYLDYHPDFEDVTKNWDKHYKILIEGGGDEVSKKLADMLLELKDNGCLDHIMQD